MTLTIITPDELQSATSVLATTKSWVAAYAKKEAVLLETANKEGVKLTPETDTAINDFLASLKKANKTANENRMPFTRKLDEVKAYFTAEEALLKGLEVNLQGKRDASVKAYAQEQAAQDAADKLKLDKAKARIEMFAEAEAQIRNGYAALLATDKGLLLNAFETCTLETINGVEDVLEGVVGTLEVEVWNGINASLTDLIAGQIISDELEQICIDAKAGKLEKVSTHYQGEIKGYAEHLLSLLPERKKELEEGKASAAAETLRKEQEDAAKLQAEQSQVRQEEQVAKQVGAAVIDVQIDQAKRGLSIPKTQSIESYSIEVLEQAGWSEIFKFYSTHCDKDMSEKTTLGTMRLFAEAEAKRNGTVIESKYLHYEPKYKAVVKSKKAA